MELNDQEIIDYLLGDSKELEQLRMEESLFSGDDLFERLSAIENRLIDLYILDKLSDSEREAFENKYLISGRRRAVVEGSRQFIELLISYRSRQPSRSEAKWDWLRSLFGQHNKALQFALASLLMTVSVGFVWLLVERVQLKQRTAAAEAALRQKEEELRSLGLTSERASAERAALDQRQEELNRNEELLRRREEELRALEARAATKTMARASFATFVLSNTVRSGPDTRELIIRSGDKFVRLIAYLDDDKAERYRASLQRVSGEEVWTTVLQKPRSELKRLTLTVPTSTFKDKDYFVKIEGLTRDGQRTNLVEYSLTVKNERTRD